MQLLSAVMEVRETYEGLTHILQDTMGCLRFVGFLKSSVSFAKEPYNRDDILQKSAMILSSLLIVATPFVNLYCRANADTSR